MDTAAVVGINTTYLFLTFLPPILWLLFYLREDRHPEPKLLLLLTFFGGMVSVLFAIFAECTFMQLRGGGSCQEGINYDGQHIFTLFLAIAFIEEYIKYGVVKFLVLRKKDFDEPVDAMIYLITAALGFAAAENALFTFPLLHQNLFAGLEITTNRFLGANLLHALSSGIVGFFLARAWFSPHRHHFIAIGIIIATFLHAMFNYLILIRESMQQGIIYLFLLLTMMAVVVFIDFERLRNTKSKSGDGRSGEVPNDSENTGNTQRPEDV